IERIRPVARWRLLFAGGYRSSAGHRSDPAAENGRLVGGPSRSQVLGRACDEPSRLQESIATRSISDAGAGPVESFSMRKDTEIAVRESEFRLAIHQTRNCEAEVLESIVHVKGPSGKGAPWERKVHVFEVSGHSKATRCSPG